MEIPDSIAKLTSESVADNFITKVNEQQRSVNDIINIIKQRTDLINYKYFEEGLVAYKQNINLDKNFIKNLLTIYSSAIDKALQNSTITDDAKLTVTKTYKNTINGVITNIEAIHELATTLNQDENIIDVLQISYIILGYVIDTIKKHNESRDRG